MARIDPSRRAQIGRERRERTRQVLLTAAKRVFAEAPIDRLSVDDVVASAGLAKGTFYYHFRDFDALIVAIGEELAAEFDALLQPQRSTLATPAERLAWGLYAFLRRAEREPSWGRLVRHARFADDGAASGVREHLAADVAGTLAEGRCAPFAAPFAVRLVFTMALEYLDERDTAAPSRPAAAVMVAAILRALGVADAAAAGVVARVSAAAGLLEAPAAEGG
jgi:AcrR family transcriptional regulator